MMRSERVFIVKNFERSARKGKKKDASMLFLLSRAKDLSPKMIEKLAWKLYLGSLAAILLAASPTLAAEKMTDAELMVLLGGGDAKPQATVSAASESAAAPAEPKTGAISKIKSALKSLEGQKPVSTADAAKAAKTDADKKAKPKVTLPAPDEVFEAKGVRSFSLEGTVSASSPRGIAVEYNVTKEGVVEEIWVNYTSAMKLEGAASLKDFGPGDRVRLDLRELTDKSRRQIETLALVAKAPVEPVPSEPPAPAESAAGTAEVPQ